MTGSISTADSSSSGRLKKDVFSKKRNILKKNLKNYGSYDGKGGCKGGKGGPISDALKNVASNVSNNFSKGWSNTKDILKYYINKPINALKRQDIVDEQNARNKVKPYIEGYKAMMKKTITPKEYEKKNRTVSK